MQGFADAGTISGFRGGPSEPCSRKVGRKGCRHLNPGMLGWNTLWCGGCTVLVRQDFQAFLTGGTGT